MNTIEFETTAETSIPAGWGEYSGHFLSAVIKVRATGANDGDWIVNLNPETIVDFSGENMAAKDLAVLLGCSIHKLGDLFIDSVATDVYVKVCSSALSIS